MKKHKFILNFGRFSQIFFLIQGFWACGTVVNNPGDEEQQPEDTTKRKPPENKTGGDPLKSEGAPGDGAYSASLGPSVFTEELQQTLSVCPGFLWESQGALTGVESGEDTLIVEFAESQVLEGGQLAAFGADRKRLGALPLKVTPGVSFFVLVLKTESPICFLSLTTPSRGVGLGSAKWKLKVGAQAPL